MEKYRTKDNALTFVLPQRLDSENSADCKIEMIDFYQQEATEKALPVILDASGTTYISSSGLRAILKLKKISKSVTMTEVSSEVYEILDMTGFNSFIDVRRKMKQISVEGCEVIGRGFNGTIYKLDPDTIIKVFREGMSIITINHSIKVSKWVFLEGLPTPISFNLAAVGNQIGIVFEMLQAKSVSEQIDQNRDAIDKYLEQYVLLMKQLHQVQADHSLLSDKKKQFSRIIDQIQADISEEAYQKIQSFFEAIPDTDTVIHGDFHVGNVMSSEEEMFIIDLDNIGYGHPIFDLLNIHASMIEFPLIRPEYNCVNMDRSLYQEVWDRTFQLYYADKTEAERQKLENQIEALALVRVLLFCKKYQYPEEKKALIRERLYAVLGRKRKTAHKRRNPTVAEKQISNGKSS